MAFYGRKPPHAIRVAQGFEYLFRYFHGESIASIARHFGRDRATVSDRMKTAAATLIESTQQQMMSEVMPEAIQLLKAVIKQQLKQAAEGKTIDTGLVERLMKGLYITDAPQLRNELEALHPRPGHKQLTEGEAEETLAGFVARRVLKPAPDSQQPVIEGQKVEDADAN